MKQKRKTTERDEQLDMIVYLIRFNKDSPPWKYYKPAGWVIQTFSYETVIEELWELDFTELIKGNGFKGLYGFLYANLTTIHFEKKAELQKAKHFKLDQERTSIKNDDFLKRSKDRLKTLISMRNLYTGKQKQKVDQEIKLITKKLGIEI